MAIFKANTQTRKQLFWTFLTTFGVLENEYSRSLIDKALTMEVLFEEED